MKKIILIILVPLILMQSSCFGLFLISDISDIFNDWNPVDSNSAVVSYQKHLIHNGKHIEYLKYLNNYYGSNRTRMPGDHLICIYDDNLYGIWDFWKNLSYDLFELNLETNEVKIITTQKYEETIMDVYPACHYYEGEIIIENGTRIIAYNIAEQMLNEYSTDDYSIPADVFEISFKNDQIEISKEGCKRTIDFNYMCDRNQNLSELRTAIEKKPRRFYSVKEEIVYFYKVNAINNEIFIVMGVRERDGEATLLMFQYDFDNDSFNYVYGEFFSESYPPLYMIPVV